jgi:ABC-type polysaccharide/polyol phosphate export permease
MSYNSTAMLRTWYHFWELLWGMTEKELRARYKYTVFGFVWLVANPILQMLIIGFVFTYFMKEPVEHYYYHLFIGLLVWNFFSLSLTKATPSIVHERSLIKKSAFPRAVIPLSIILSNFIHFFLAFFIFMVPVSFLGTLSAYTLPHLIGACGFLILFTTGLCLLTSALNVRYRDINFFVQALLLLWFYATPIMYSLSQMPRELLWIWRFNPLTSTIQLFHHALLAAPGPGPAMLAANIAVMLFITTVGILLFKDQSKTFDDWI